MKKGKQELIDKLEAILENRLLDNNLNDDERINIQNLLDFKADSYSEKSFLGIYKNDNPFWYWSFKIVIILGIAIPLFIIILKIL